MNLEMCWKVGYLLNDYCVRHESHPAVTTYKMHGETIAWMAHITGNLYWQKLEVPETLVVLVEAHARLAHIERRSHGQGHSTLRQTATRPIG